MAWVEAPNVRDRDSFVNLARSQRISVKPSSDGHTTEVLVHNGATTQQVATFPDRNDAWAYAGELIDGLPFWQRVVGGFLNLARAGVLTVEPNEQRPDEWAVYAHFGNRASFMRSFGSRVEAAEWVADLLFEEDDDQ